ncbi:alpha/beta fold hydrolase [Kamptonema cortianum]|nr:alpha/beta fold hydrolase [Oscillatoria laete-virens]MDK3157953.1 alpha/beta fold hydrolase [Kamptonema cortianum]MDL5046078.1 alpha/beta fold hydrolase [Oscillatoria amoena NRMC-F 0135]MDL5052784.1 alpha/beta fold hydrolase [Oscillatoria laete-virens NRMC-F 0139]
MNPKARALLVKSLRSILLTAIVIYAFINLAGVWLQNAAMFPVPPVLQKESPPWEFTLETADGIPIRAVWLGNPDAKMTILFSHGNGEDIDRIIHFLGELRFQGFNVLAYDYRGYGRSGGAPSERGLERDITAAYEWLTTTQQIAPERIILMGRSIGGGPSVWLATQKPVAGLILESAFTSAYEVLLPRLPYYRNPFPNESRLRNLRVPTLFIHGTHDMLIAPGHAKRNYAAAAGPKELVWIPLAGHNDVMATDMDTYIYSLVRFARGLEPQESGPQIVERE